ncbi:Uncharacterized protein FWK35_00010004 [Aphis craccivora]|uniref:Uncharacterized protein n=1 Tax=Aphis craccivora TaxID=307492 RepID=A0A6G0Y9I0_APHCR|nr:Uncharacterized protein FWK35_00010004 [Aphis craccivora]
MASFGHLNAPFDSFEFSSILLKVDRSSASLSSVLLALALRSSNFSIKYFQKIKKSGKTLTYGQHMINIHDFDEFLLIFELQMLIKKKLCLFRTTQKKSKCFENQITIYDLCRLITTNIKNRLRLNLEFFLQIIEEKFMENLVSNFQNLIIKEKNFTIFQPQNYSQIFAILTYFYLHRLVFESQPYK